MLPVSAENTEESVVPHAGTWIEILTYDTIARRFQSFPTRERGLKCKINIGDKDWEASFPTRERGLKLRVVIVLSSGKQSFPTRERGLKSLYGIIPILTGLSFPTRERGLK